MKVYNIPKEYFVKNYDIEDIEGQRIENIIAVEERNESYVGTEYPYSIKVKYYDINEYRDYADNELTDETINEIKERG